MRRLPAILDPDQRFRFEALVFAADVIELALGRLRSITANAGLDIGSIADADFTDLFSSCWTIVDQLHLTRQIFRGRHFRDTLSPETQRWVNQYEPATILRNKMDHIQDNIPNLSKLKGYTPPLFGALSYFLILDDNIADDSGRRTVRGGHAVTISSGSSAGDQMVQLLTPIGETEFRPPTCLFRLEGFDQLLDLEEAAEGLRSILARMNDMVESAFDIQLAKSVEITGLTRAELSNPAAPNMVVIASMDFVKLDER